MSGPIQLNVVGREVWLVTNLPAEIGGYEHSEIWRTDGTEAGTQLVWEAPGHVDGYLITGLTHSGRHLFFRAPTAVDETGTGVDFKLHAIRLPGDSTSGGRARALIRAAAG